MVTKKLIVIICEVKKIGYFDDEKTNQDDFAINQAVYEPKFDIEEIEKLKMIEAKLYGDLFVRASVRRNFQREPINKTGREYIENSENNPMQIIDFINKHENSYIKLPSEVKEKKSSWISRFWNNIYSKIATIFGFKNNTSAKKTMQIPAPSEDIPKTNVGELTEEELCDVREATQKTVEEYLSNNGNSRDNDRPSTQRNEDIV